MALVHVHQIKPGDRLIQDVMTARNHQLMLKGTMLTAREIEILQAFLIQKVHIEGETEGSAEGNASTDSAAVQAGSLLSLYEEYDKLLVLMKQVFSLAGSGGELPVLNIRNHLEAVLSHIGEYNLLFFRPPKYHARDYLYHQSIRTAMSSYQLAKWCGLQQKDLIPVALGGLMHDIGNTRIDPEILHKTARLTANEVQEIREHTKLGYSILKNVAGFNEGTKLVALQHHEREDGSGYPLGLKGDNIHLYTKIVAVADIYHAMSTTRVYRQAISPYLVLEELLQYSFGKLDPKIVRTFIDKVTQFHTGTIVKLSDDRIGEIVFSQREHPTRPWVNVNGTIVNLTIERGLHIQEIIQNG